MKIKTAFMVMIFCSSALSGCTGNDSEKDDRIEALEIELSESISDHDSSLGQSPLWSPRWPNPSHHWKFLKTQCLI